MSNIEMQIETLFEKAENYSKTSIELVKLKLIDKSAEVVSGLIARLAISIIILLFVLIISIGISLWIGDLLGKTYYGFFVVAGVYAFIAILLRTYLHQLIITPISNSFIRQMLNQKVI